VHEFLGEVSATLNSNNLLALPPKLCWCY
jgi:hypothetical protein